MFVYNMKFGSKKIIALIIGILVIFILFFIGTGIYKNIKNSKTKVSDDTSSEKINYVSSSNYTSILKEVHNNLNSYVGQKIRFIGFIYRLYDFNEDQFVLAREMVVSSNYQGVVVGFLCHLNGANKYKDGEWVEVEGTITKGDYHGEIPLVDIYKIEQTAVPSDEYVYPPDNTYIKTDNIL